MKRADMDVQATLARPITAVFGQLAAPTGIGPSLTVDLARLRRTPAADRQRTAPVRGASTRAAPAVRSGAPAGQ